MNETLEWIREAWAEIPILFRIVGGVVLFWAIVFIFYGRKALG